MESDSKGRRFGTQRDQVYPRFTPHSGFIRIILGFHCREQGITYIKKGTLYHHITGEKQYYKERNMAKIDEGILGPFSGKVGEVIGSSWHGIPYIKSRPAVFHDAKSPAQLAQRMRMQVAHQFVKSIKNIITIGYRYVAGEQIPYNKAVSYIVKNAIVGEYPDMG